MEKASRDKLADNMIFVGTIYDSFEALEETLGKLRLEKPLFITHIAKMAFVEEVFKRAEKSKVSCEFTPSYVQREKKKNHSKLYN